MEKDWGFLPCDLHHDHHEIQVTKNWRRRRPGNEASQKSICIMNSQQQTPALVAKELISWSLFALGGLIIPTSSVMTKKIMLITHAGVPTQEVQVFLL